MSFRTSGVSPLSIGLVPNVRLATQNEKQNICHCLFGKIITVKCMSTQQLWPWSHVNTADRCLICIFRLLQLSCIAQKAWSFNDVITDLSLCTGPCMRSRLLWRFAVRALWAFLGLLRLGAFLCQVLTVTALWQLYLLETHFGHSLLEFYRT